ncbi:HECT-type ubiquitin ligase-interacting protein apyA [Aspergillus crustosus]
MALHHLKPKGKTQAQLQREYLNVELDKDYVVFQGAEQEALAVYLSGQLTFAFNEPLAVKYIRLHLSGVRRISLPTLTAWRRGKEEEFFKQTWEFHDAYRATPQILPGGEYKFPFDVLLEGSLPETVEGLKETSIVYFFTVEIGRKRGKDVTFQKPLRVLRVPAYASDMILDETWCEKIAYRIEIPNKNVPFGGLLDVSYEFVPLLDGLKVQMIESELLEMREFTLNANDSRSKSTATTAVLLSDRYDIKQTESTTKSAEAYQFSRSLQLPRVLGQSVQDTDVMGIRVHHKLKVNIRMHNPDGHLSELRLTIPVSIYLSPAYPVWDSTVNVGDTALFPVDILGRTGDEPLPPYGKHALDRVFGAQDQLSTGV